MNTPTIPNWVWLVSVGTGILLGCLSKSIFAPTKFWSWRTFGATVAAAAVTIFLWWISATEYEPFKAGLARYILASGGVAALTAMLWTLLKR